MDALLYAEISNEIRTRQETDLYLSSLYDSEDKEGVFYLVSALESYRRTEWAAEMIRSYPEKDWQMALHKGC
jgi:hypothetical protein